MKKISTWGKISLFIALFILGCRPKSNQKLSDLKTTTATQTFKVYSTEKTTDNVFLNGIPEVKPLLGNEVGFRVFSDKFNQRVKNQILKDIKEIVYFYAKSIDLEYVKNTKKIIEIDKQEFKEFEKAMFSSFEQKLSDKIFVPNGKTAVPIEVGNKKSQINLRTEFTLRREDHKELQFLIQVDLSGPKDNITKYETILNDDNYKFSNGEKFRALNSGIKYTGKLSDIKIGPLMQKLNRIFINFDASFYQDVLKHCINQSTDFYIQVLGEKNKWTTYQIKDYQAFVKTYLFNEYISKSQMMQYPEVVEYQIVKEWVEEQKNRYSDFIVKVDIESLVYGNKIPDGLEENISLISSSLRDNKALFKGRVKISTLNEVNQEYGGEFEYNNDTNLAGRARFYLKINDEAKKLEIAHSVGVTLNMIHWISSEARQSKNLFDFGKRAITHNFVFRKGFKLFNQFIPTGMTFEDVQAFHAIHKEVTEILQLIREVSKGSQSATE